MKLKFDKEKYEQEMADFRRSKAQLLEEQRQLQVEKQKYEQEVVKLNRLEAQLKALKKQYKVEIGEFNRKNENFVMSKQVNEMFHKVCSIERKMVEPLKFTKSFETTEPIDLPYLMQEEDDSKFVAKLCTSLFTTEELLYKTTCRKKNEKDCLDPLKLQYIYGELFKKILTIFRLYTLLPYQILT